MKFIILKLAFLVLVSVLVIVGCLKTETMTHSKTKTKTQSHTKMSIFSSNLLSLMKRKITMKEKNLQYADNANVNQAMKNDAEKDEDRKDEVKTKKLMGVKPKISNSTVSNKPDNQTDEMSSSSILYQGWAKYFKYQDSGTSGKKPSSFFRNNEFYEQTKNYADFNIEKRSTDGNCIFVPDEAYWWIILINDSIVISGSRKESTKKVFDNLSLDKLSPILEGRGYKGGLTDFGSFSEGSCFKLTTENHYTWIFCTDLNDEKMKFMDAIKNIKLQMQRAKGDVEISSEKAKQESLDSLIDKKKNDDDLESNSNEDKKPNDGYWIILQTWSQCSKKCDTGVSTLHRLCIPPKNGGKPCQGEAIKTRPCNPEPCPYVPGQESNKNSTDAKIREASKPVTLKPIFKSMPFSSTPTRYHKCIIKEGDLILYKTEDKGLKPKITQIPVRAILNNRTISFYENAEDFSTHYTSFNLKTSDFFHSKRDRSCFILSENQRQSELCPIGADPSLKTYNDWDKDFNIFKFNCESKPDEIEADLDNKMKEKMEEAKKDLLQEREEMIKKKMRDKDEDTGFSIIKKTNQVAQQAIIKEENLEEMIEKEEEEKEKRDEEMILKQIESEKKKNDCIKKAIKEREIENQYQIKTSETQKEVESIKQDAMKEVLEKRNKLKQKINEMRKKAQRKSQALKAKLLNMKMSMAQEMTDIYKKGDHNRCSNAMKDDQSRQNYCTANFSDIIMYSQCRDNEDFCTLCCEHEFGEMHMDKRNECIKTLCEAPKADAEESKGRWVWNEPVKTE
jgi:hypothetical protein